MTVILSSLNLKGGVGKTTIAVNYAAHCGSKGRRTLLIDLDPQANASFGMIGLEEWEAHAKDNGTVADLLGARTHTSADGTSRGYESVVRKDAFPNVDLIPSHLDLFTVDLDLAGKTSRERLLYRSIKNHTDDYDIIICDCPPNLTLPTQNALALSTHFVVPVSLDYLSVLGIGLLLSRVNRICEDLDKNIENAGIVISRVGRTSRHRQETEATVRSQFGSTVLSGKIADRTAISKAMEDRKPIHQISDESAKAEFAYLFDELDDRLDLK